MHDVFCQMFSLHLLKGFLVFSLVDVTYQDDCFDSVEVSWHAGDKYHLVMVNNLLNVLLDLLASILLKIFASVFLSLIHI